MKRELDILSREPPPGISCWMVDDQIDKLQAGFFISYTLGFFIHPNWLVQHVYQVNSKFQVTSQRTQHNNPYPLSFTELNDTTVHVVTWYFEHHPPVQGKTN